MLLGASRQALPPPRDGEIRVLSWKEQHFTEVWLTLEPRSPAGKPAAPGTVLTWTLRVQGERLRERPDSIELRAHAGMLWAPQPELWIVLNDKRRMNLTDRRVLGGLNEDGGLQFLPVSLPVGTLQQIARATKVTGRALGFEFELTGSQRSALKAFVDRVLTRNPAVPDSPALAPTGRWVEPITGMTFVEIPAGHFNMGSPVGERGRERQERRHEVVITRPFWMGVFEVTQAQWLRVMGENPSWFHESGDLPVERVSWHEALEFAGRLTDLAPGSRFRLPTEAEWEYACRAGTDTAYHVGSTLTTSDANVTERPDVDVRMRGGTTPAGLFPPNAWGLHDMHGNVWEWTRDDHCPYPEGPALNPSRACDSPVKVIRGGSWYFTAESARCALRYTHAPGDRGFSLGLRLVREERAS